MIANTGAASPLLICTRIGNSIHLIDPNTLQVADIQTQIYWRSPFASLADVQELVEFVVLDIEPLGPTHGKYVLADAHLVKTADTSFNRTYQVRTHLGGILHPGDSVLGYHLTSANLNNPQFEALEKISPDSIQEVMLVKKNYPRKKKSKNRNWRLKRMALEESEMLPRKQDQERAERDYEMFLRDVEEDTELRNSLALYKSTRKNPPRTQRMEGIELQHPPEQPPAASEIGEDSDEDGELPEISLEELLDDLEGMRVED